MNKWALIGVAAVALAAGGWWFSRPPGPMSSANGMQTNADGTQTPIESGEMVAVKLPELTGSALRGQQVFGAICAACHGPNAGGIEGSAPPLINRLYVPGHHSDMAIRLAVRRGVQSHHWRFGNMPVIEGLTDADITDIIAFIRAVQKENGII